MKYEQLIEYMHLFRTEKISRAEFMCAFHIWQRAYE